MRSCLTMIRLLLVEDDVADARHFQRALSRAQSCSFEITHAVSIGDARARLGWQEFDAVVLDLSLPDSSGIDTIRSLRDAAASMPIVILSGLDDEAMAIEAIREGAQDYIVKWPCDADMLSHVIRHSIERKKSERQLERYARQLEQSNAELEQYGYVVSHDLREPLRMISSYTSLLNEEYSAALDDDARRYLHYAHDGARRMGTLIDGLLDYSRVGRLNAAVEPVDLNDAAIEVLAALKTEIESSGATVHVERLPQVLGNWSRLVQLLQHLVDNALKFRQESGPVIDIACEVQGEFCQIAVQDNGIGIEAQFHERIFQMFQRLHTRDEYPGTGIGLALCKKIVEQYGGRLSVASEPDNGATFYFTLPVADKKKFSSKLERRRACLR